MCLFFCVCDVSIIFLSTFRELQAIFKKLQAIFRELQASLWNPQVNPNKGVQFLKN